MGPQGIFKPALLDLPISITTVPVVEGRPRPYEDEIDPEGLLTYRYRGTDPSHRDNERLRLAMARRTPLIYFDGVVPGQYLASWPVFIVGDDPDNLSFKIDVDTRRALGETSQPEIVAEARRQYVISTVRHCRTVRYGTRGLMTGSNSTIWCLSRGSSVPDDADVADDGVLRLGILEERLLALPSCRRAPDR